ncbi:MAG TPA: alpha/beta hydrolase [Polyangiaceae bacterium]|nr:alpha/beta hydrolase [Polyangiaceae bacterium]
MATFVLIPGAGGAASYWHRVVPMLAERGHQATAVGLPGSDERAGLDVYTARVLDAIDGRRVVLVAQSLGGFTAAQVCARASVEQLVFVNAMIPNPGETAGAWWDVTGSEKARVAAAEARGYATTFDDETYFFHDVPKEVVEADKEEHAQAKIIFSEPCRFERWPDVPMHVIVGKDDRFFPAQFQARVAKERLGLSVDEIPGGHLVALSNPEGLVARLVAYVGSAPA